MIPCMIFPRKKKDNQGNKIAIMSMVCKGGKNKNTLKNKLGQKWARLNTTIVLSIRSFLQSFHEKLLCFKSTASLEENCESSQSAIILDLNGPQSISSQ